MEWRRRSFGNNRKRFWLPSLAALPVLVLVYALIFPGALTRLHEGFLGGMRGDPAIYIWLIQNSVRNVLTWPSQGFDIGLYYPFGRALAYTDNFLLPALVAKPLLLSGLSLETTFNSIIIGAIILNGYFTFALVYRISGSFFAGLVSGIAFLGCPFLAAHVPHTQLQFAFFLPWALLSLYIFFEKESFLAATTVGFCVVAAFLSAVYYSLFSIVVVLFFLAGLLASKRFKEAPRTMAILAVMNIPWVIALAIVSTPYRQVAEALGVRGSDEVYPLQATLASYASASEDNLFWGPSTAYRSHFEARFFAGAIISFFALLAVLSIFRAVTARTRVLLGGGAIAVVLSFFVSEDLRPYFVGGGFWVLLVGEFFALTEKGTPSIQARKLFLLVATIGTFISLGFLSPYGADKFEPGLFPYLFEYIPGFSAIRAVGRFGVVTYLALCVLAGLAVAAVLEKIHSGARILIALALVGAVIFEFRSTPRNVEAETPIPGAWQRLAQIPGDEAVLALPFGFIPKVKGVFALMQTDYMRFSQPTNRPIVNGHSGVMPGFFHYLDPKMEHFPDAQSLAILREIVGLRYVVFMPKYAPDFVQTNFEAALAERHDELSLVTKDDGGNYLIEFQPIRRLSTKAIDLRFSPDSRHARPFRFTVEANDKVENACPDELIVNVQTKREQTPRTALGFTLLSDGKPHDFEAILPPSPGPVNWHTVRVDMNTLPADCEVYFKIR